MNSEYYWLIDAGHGGMTPEGVYTTAPRKMKKFADGFTIYEGLINRWIAEILYKNLEGAKIPFALVYDEVKDISLTGRYTLANTLFRKHPNAIFLSIHSNASVDIDGDGSGDGKGFEVWTSPGQTKSDILAESLCLMYKKNFPDFKFRADKTDGDLDQESKFTVLTETLCPAVLVENLFFDNRSEAEYLSTVQGREKIADTLLEWILQVENTKPI